MEPQPAVESKSRRAQAPRKGMDFSATLPFLTGWDCARGCRRVSLETGTVAVFTPARALYASAGFEVCPPFNGYWDSPYSVCMTLELDGLS